MNKLYNTRTTAGVTLIELLVTLTVLAILTAIGYPNYIKFKLETNRAEATTTLIDMHSGIQNYLIATNSATLLNSNLNSLYSSSLPTTPIPTKPNGYYNITVPITTATPPSYTITATTVSSSIQANDTNCAKLMIDNNGVKTSKNSSAVASAGCW